MGVGAGLGAGVGVYAWRFEPHWLERVDPVRNRRYTAGEFGLPGGRRMYISRGVGHLLRVRFNVRPEMTIFHLERG
jgi:predicted MPP superfamily phosphohydrolase